MTTTTALDWTGLDIHDCEMCGYRHTDGCVHETHDVRRVWRCDRENSTYLRCMTCE